MSEEVKKIDVLDAIKAITLKLSLSESDSNRIARVYTEQHPDEEVIIVEPCGAESERYKDGHQTQQVIVSIHHDQDAHDPSSAGGDDGCWTLYGFNDRLLSFKHPEELGFNADQECDAYELQKKLDDGRAFRLGYYEHGQCSWFIQGQGGPGSDCPWDGTRFAGVAVFEDEECPMGATTYEDRAKDCAGFLENYTAWSNGECYGYQVTTVGGEYVDSCWGFYGNGLEDMFAQIREATEGKVIVEVTGDASDMASYHEVQTKVEEACPNTTK